jgi:hypothetical protein
VSEAFDPAATWMTTRLPNAGDGVFRWDGRRERGYTQRVGHDEWPAAPPLLPVEDLVGVLTQLNGLARSSVHPAGHRLASDWVVDPQWTQAPLSGVEPCWDLLLVVDAGRSMVIWDATIAELVGALRNWRTFRSIDVSEVDTDALVPEPRRPTDPRIAPDATPPSESRCRIVIVLTDGLGAAWASGGMRPLLYDWGRGSAIAIVHLLPERLWSITRIHPFGTQLRAQSPESPAASIDWVDALESSELDDADAFPVPVLELDVRWLRAWVGFLVRSPSWSYLQVIPVGPQRTTIELQPDTAESPASELVNHFHKSASPEVFALATHLAAAPLNLPVIRLVQGELLPRSRPFHLTELLAGGLLRPVLPRSELLAHDRITFEFATGVREELLAAARRAQTLNVARLVTRYLGAHVPCVRMFGEVLEDATGPDVPPLTPETAPYARVFRVVLDALSGQYRAPAQQIRAALADYD